MIIPSAWDVKARICKNVLVVTDYCCFFFRDCTASRKNQFEFKGTQLIRNMHWVASGHCVEMLTLKQAILTTYQESVVID